MPHLEKLGSHVMVMNYRQACVSPEALSPALLRSAPACTHTAAVPVFHVGPTDNYGLIRMCVASIKKHTVLHSHDTATNSEQYEESHGGLHYLNNFGSEVCLHPQMHTVFS